MERPEDTRPFVRSAVEYCGSQKKLAQRLSEILGRDIKQQNVWRWLNTVKVIDGDIARGLDEATEGQIDRAQVRPDIFTQESAA